MLYCPLGPRTGLLPTNWRAKAHCGGNLDINLDTNLDTSHQSVSNLDSNWLDSNLDTSTNTNPNPRLRFFMVVVGKHFTFCLLWFSWKSPLSCQTKSFVAPLPTSIKYFSSLATSCCSGRSRTFSPTKSLKLYRFECPQEWAGESAGRCAPFKEGTQTARPRQGIILG